MKRLSRNDAVLVSCLGVVALMGGAAYAAVPLYYMFCAATGYGGTPNRADHAPGAQGKMVTVRFDTNVDRELPWTFAAEQRSVRVRLGEDKLVFFRATNNSDQPITGHATFNVTPENAARHFSKIQCFCFTEQKLAAGQTIEMPVSFFVDPALVTDRNSKTVTEITLSYSFFQSAKNKTAFAAPSGTGG